jgi:hypothetical protein
MIAFDDDSNRIKMIAHTQCLLFFLPSEKRSLARCQSSKSPNSCSKSGKNDCGDWEDRKQPLQNFLRALPALRMMLVYKAAATCMQARWRAAA